MVKKTMQKLVPLDSNKKDIKKLESDLADGWVISNMMPHQKGFLCVLEKTIETSELNSNAKDEEFNLSKLLASTKTSNTKKKRFAREDVMA